jgi:hypothetical protein
MVSMTLMICMMKMHSYFVYIVRHFNPTAEQVPIDEHVPHNTRK